MLILKLLAVLALMTTLSVGVGLWICWLVQPREDDR
jgi:hypothetical protein